VGDKFCAWGADAHIDAMVRLAVVRWARAGQTWERGEKQRKEKPKRRGEKEDIVWRKSVDVTAGDFEAHECGQKMLWIRI